MKNAQHLEFEQTKFAVADDQEVAAPASRVEEGECTESFVKLLEASSVCFDGFQFGV